MAYNQPISMNNENVQSDSFRLESNRIPNTRNAPAARPTPGRLATHEQCVRLKLPGTTSNKLADLPPFAATSILIWEFIKFDCNFIRIESIIMMEW